MSERTYVLPEQESVIVSGKALQKLIESCSGDAALLYLYILKNHGVLSLKDAAESLKISSAEIEKTMLILSRLGLVEYSSVSSVSEEPPIKDELPEYTAEDIKHEIENGSVFRSLVQEVQRALGKILSSDDLIKLFGIYDSLGLPPEVILLLVTHCIGDSGKRYGQKHRPTMRYIEKAAYTWEHEGIFSLEKAEEYLKSLEKNHLASEEIKAVLQIKGRDLISSEQKYINSWTEMGFGADAIEIAYDRTVLKTGNLAWNYLNTILKSWHSKNLHSAEEIMRSDGKRPTSVRPTENAAPTAEDMKYMKRMLEKVKGN